MAGDLTFHRIARADLFGIYGYIERRNGMARAGTFLERIESACRGLMDFPEKGTPREDIAAGLRTWALERRVLIVYRPTAERVEILRVLYAGRDFQSEDVPH